MRFMTMLKFDENHVVRTTAAGAVTGHGGLHRGRTAQRQGASSSGGLRPSEAGAIVSLVDGTIKAVDGPFTEARELVGGYAVIEVHSKAEAIEDARRLMQIHADHWPGFSGSCEVRQLDDPEAGPNRGLTRRSGSRSSGGLIRAVT